MKQLIWIIFLFLCAIGLAMLAKTYTGNVYFVVEGYSLRMNLNFFIIAALLSVFVWYLLIKLLVSIFGTPHRLSQFGASRRSRKAAQELNAAGLAYFEGKFQEAAQHADKVLANKQAGDNRILALMLAAHAADQSHNTEARDHYLDDIAKLPSKTQLSRHLLLAESALNQQDYDTATTHLTTAAQINPRLTRLARLQLRMALDKGDALDILDKTEKLHRAGAMNDTEAQQTAEVAYRKLLDLATDAAGMKACLKRIPEALRNNALNVAIARKYNELGLYDQAIAWVNTHYPATRDANLLPPFVASVRYLDDRRQQKARQALAEAGVGEAQSRALWQQLGQAYFVRHSADIILWHLPLLAANAETPQAHIRPLSATNGLQVMVFMPNRDRLFAGLCRLFGRHQLGILAAHAYVTDHQYILDTFVLQLPANCLPDDIERISTRLQQALDQFVHHPPSDVEPSPSPHRLSRRLRHLPIAPRITLSAEETAGAYTLEIIAANRAFLLADIADVFAQLNISLSYAAIATFDERVEDSFLIRHPQLADTAFQLKLERLLLERIGG